MRIEYVPLPPPQDINGMPVYVQSELQRISRFLGGLSEVHDGGLYLSAAGTFTFLSASRSTLTFSMTVNDQSGGSVPSHIGVYLNGVLVQPDYTITFSGSAYSNITFSLKGVSAIGDVVDIRMSKESGTSTTTFSRLRADIEGKPIDV